MNTFGIPETGCGAFQNRRKRRERRGIVQFSPPPLTHVRLAPGRDSLHSLLSLFPSVHSRSEALPCLRGRSGEVIFEPFLKMPENQPPRHDDTTKKNEGANRGGQADT